MDVGLVVVVVIADGLVAIEGSERSEGQVFDFFVKRSITCPRDLAITCLLPLHPGIRVGSSVKVV